MYHTCSVIRQIFPFQNYHKNLDPSYEMDLDLWDCLRRVNRPFSHCLCACVYRSRGALFLDNRRDFTEMGQTDFKPLILSM